MKERPILFSRDMVNAILDDRKTQTRRIVKPEPHAGVRWCPIVVNGYGGWTDGHGTPLRCRYGASGDRLWVKETWRAPADATGPKSVRYAASASDVECGVSKWRTLEITDVRVQPLRTISEADAKAEGVIHDGSYRNYRDHFFDLWKRINGAASFEANPWVWAITFRRIR